MEHALLLLGKKQSNTPSRRIQTGGFLIAATKLSGGKAAD
jgi:hypothetical protein